MRTYELRVNRTQTLIILPNPERTDTRVAENLMYVVANHKYTKTMVMMKRWKVLIRCSKTKKLVGSLIMIGGHGCKPKFKGWAPNNKGKVQKSQVCVVMCKEAITCMSKTTACSWAWCNTLASRILHRVHNKLWAFFSFFIYFCNFLLFCFIEDNV